MTLPYQRTIAVLRAKAFLTRLSSAYIPDGIKGIRREVRQEARAILRHFPSGYELADKESFDAAAVDAWYEARNA